MISRSAWARVDRLFKDPKILEAKGIEEFGRSVVVFDDLYKRVRRIPTWPFDGIIVAKLAAYLAPAVLSLLSGLTLRLIGK